MLDNLRAGPKSSASDESFHPIDLDADGLNPDEHFGPEDNIDGPAREELSYGDEEREPMQDAPMKPKKPMKKGPPPLPSEETADEKDVEGPMPSERGEAADGEMKGAGAEKAKADGPPYDLPPEKDMPGGKSAPMKSKSDPSGEEREELSADYGDAVLI